MSDDKALANGDVTPSTSKRGSSSCNHLSKLLTSTGSKLEDLLLKTKARYLAGPRDEPDSNGFKRFPRGLGVVYACLQCAEAGSMSHIISHSKTEKHRISMDTRSGSLFCAYCKDAIYCPSVEHFHLYGNPHVDESKKRKFSEALESDVHITSNSSTTPCNRDGVRGLFNLGQTCYMNAVLQSLLHDPLLVSYFLGEGHSVSRCEVVDCIACAMTEVFTECRATDRQDGFPALNLLMATWKQIPTLAGYAQQDAHEYYQALVDKLHESAASNQTLEGRCNCFFHKAFFGTLRSTITCNACGKKRKTDDPINDLSLHMEIQQAAKKKEKIGTSSGDAQKITPTLESCLDSYISKEKLTATCKNCGSTTKPATKQLKLRKLPAILCMQMKRFDHTSQSNESTKIEGKVDFPLSLNMAPYTTNHKPTSIPNIKPSSTATATISSTFPPPRIESERLIYDLTSVIVHKGTLDSGHYFAYCRESSSFPLTPPPSSSSPSSTTNTTTNTATNTTTTTTTNTDNNPQQQQEQPSSSSTTTTTSSYSTGFLGDATPAEDKWYQFNDDRVTLASVSEVLNADAYLLFYGLRWLPPQDPNRPVPPPVVKYAVDEESE